VILGDARGGRWRGCVSGKEAPGKVPGCLAAHGCLPIACSLIAAAVVSLAAGCGRGTGLTPPGEAAQPSSPEDSGRLAAEVVHVIDGDTFIADVGGVEESVRLIGIDCPEMDAGGGLGEWMAAAATEAARRLLEGQTVYLERDTSERDRYGRLLEYAFLSDGTFVNLALVEMGYCHARSYPPDVGYQDLLLEAERRARRAGRGLWGPTPTPAPLTGAAPLAAPERPSARARIGCCVSECLGDG
jgi:micrococcal nuclease